MSALIGAAAHPSPVRAATRRRQRSRSTTVAFDAPGWRLHFVNHPGTIADSIVAMLSALSPRILSKGDSDPPDGTIEWRGDTFYWSTAGRPIPETWKAGTRSSPFRLIADIHDVAIDWFLHDHPDWLCLHAAAVQTGAGLVCLPAAGRAGKSTFCAQVVATGGRFWTDDILPVDPASGRALSLALPLALRRPLPSTLPQATRKFLRKRRGPMDAKWRYVRLETHEIAPFGTMAPIAAIVLPKRHAKGPARLTAIDPSQAMSELIAGNLATRVASDSVLTSLADMVAKAGCYRLVYSDVADAAALLADHFGVRCA